MARPRQPLLTRERIVETALALIDAEGLEAVSTRRLAAELGVRGPSLYNHFATKDEILDALADVLLAPVDSSSFGTDDWRVALYRWAHSYHRALAAHPHVAPLASEGPGRRPASLAMAENVYVGLVAAGWPPARATHVGAMFRYLVVGSVLGSFAGGFVDDPALYAERYPGLSQAHLLAARRTQVDEGAFTLAVDALLIGLTDEYVSAVGPLQPLPRTAYDRYSHENLQR